MARWFRATVALIVGLALWHVGDALPRRRRYSKRSAEEMGLVRVQQVTADNDTAVGIDAARRGSYAVRVGLLFPRDMPLLTPKIGFATSAGAISIALRRIQLEQLLPGANWTIIARFSQCNERVAVGNLLKFINENKVDVLIGPPCSSTAVVVGVLAKYFNVPQYSWAATSVDLADVRRFPTLIRTIGSALRVGRVLKEMLLFFNWRRVALFYTDDGGTRKCYSIAAGLRKTFAANGIVNVLNVGIERANPSDDELDRFLLGVADIARIVVTCLEHEDDGRRLLLRAQQLGLSGGEYVYIMPEYVRDQNRTEVWKDLSVGESDGRDVEGKEAFRNALFVEMQMGSAEQQHYFRKQVIKEIRGYPFYHKSDNQHDQYGSLYSPFLHDALYLYALALNKTLRQGGRIGEGTLIMNNSKNAQFIGESGHVVIDEVAGREPNFIIRGFDKSMRLLTFAEALMYRPDGDTINLLVPERMIWEARGDFVPVDVPACGFYGEKCRPTGQTNIVQFVIAGALLVVVVVACVVGFVIFYIRRKLVTDEMAKLLWKIHYREIVWLNDKSRRSKSLGSLRTISTNASDETTEAIAKGDKNVARLRGFLVWAKQHQASMVLSGDSDHMHMKELRDIAHDNLNTFLGLCIDAPHPISIWKYTSKGSLEDVIHNENVKLDWFFKYSFIKDLVSGMEHLQEATSIKTHGRLRSSNCLVDARWVLKVTDYGLHKLRSQLKDSKDRLWTAPELLRMADPPLQGSPKADVYSFAIILQEIVTRDRPFCSENLSPEEIVPRVAKAEAPPFRPSVALSGDSDTDSGVIQLMNDCWKEDPDLRPDFRQAKASVRQMGRGRTVNLMDHVLRMIEKYTANLEQTVADRTRQLTDEMKKSDLLLYRMLPKSVADKLKAGQSVDPESFETASVLFSDVVGFTAITARSSPMQTVVLLNDLYTLLDDVIAEFDVYKVETIGDGYMCASGLPRRNGNKHASETADMALQFVAQVKTFYIPHLPEEKLELRVGIHTGACVAGVVGTSMPRYCLFGDTVMIANRMESTGKASCVQVSEETKRYLCDVIGGYIVKPRGEVIIKGKGVLFTYWLLGKSTKNICDNTSDTTSGKTVDSGDAPAVAEEAAADEGGQSSPRSNGSAASETAVAAEPAVKPKGRKKRAKRGRVQPAPEPTDSPTPEAADSPKPAADSPKPAADLVLEDVE